MYFPPTVWWVFNVSLPWDPFDAQTKCQHCPFHPTISDNYARLIPSTFVRFLHQQLAPNQWHFLACTTLLLWDRTQLSWNHVCRAVRLSTNKTCFSRFSTTVFNVTFTHLTETVASVQAFSCHNTLTSGCQTAFSSGRILLPLPQNITAVLGCLPSARMQTCSVHYLFFNSNAGWLTHIFWCLSPGLIISYVFWNQQQKPLGIDQSWNVEKEENGPI